ncbi:MAG: hypothetical protein ACYC6Y_13555 [Thermoguttaceae bacterium]
MQRITPVVLLTVFLPVMTGCQGDTGGRSAVTGMVTMGGKPLETGTIQFLAEDGSQMTGAPIAAGKYEVPAEQGLLPGTYKVRVSSVQGTAAAEAAPGDSAAIESKNKELVPPEYNTQSKVTAEIKEGSANTFNLDIP